MPLDLNHVAARLARFEAETGTTAPRPYLDPQGAPVPAFLRYADRTGLSLDWLCGLRGEGNRLN
ncbi:hypothetical protein HKCCSP123_00950 [Rhodobacterales bacterium HKCCSP123]|nr:hypothetical protein [Rhodobacterales bacterium HKCCSP123]